MYVILFSTALTTASLLCLTVKKTCTNHNKFEYKQLYQCKLFILQQTLFRVAKMSFG